MSNTYRKDKNYNKVKEGLKKEKPQYRCNCWHCIGYTTELKHELIDKIAEKEMKEQIRIIETGENIDFDIPEQEKILEQFYKPSSNPNDAVSNLDRFTNLSNGEMLEDLDGEYVLFSDVIKAVSILFSAQKE